MSKNKQSKLKEMKVIREDVFNILNKFFTVTGEEKNLSDLENNFIDLFESKLHQQRLEIIEEIEGMKDKVNKYAPHDYENNGLGAEVCKRCGYVFSNPEYPKACLVLSIKNNILDDILLTLKKKI